MPPPKPSRKRWKRRSRTALSPRTLPSSRIHRIWDGGRLRWPCRKSLGARFWALSWRPARPRSSSIRRTSAISRGEATFWSFRVLADAISYPAFQFSPNGRLYPEIAKILEIFSDVVETPYTIASWLVSPQDLLEGETPIAWLRAGKDSSQVLAAAQRSAGELSL